MRMSTSVLATSSSMAPIEFCEHNFCKMEPASVPCIAIFGKNTKYLWYRCAMVGTCNMDILKGAIYEHNTTISTCGTDGRRLGGFASGDEGRFGGIKMVRVMQTSAIDGGRN